MMADRKTVERERRTLNKTGPGRRSREMQMQLSQDEGGGRRQARVRAAEQACRQKT
jgi:hypothetical protein